MNAPIQINKIPYSRGSPKVLKYSLGSWLMSSPQFIEQSLFKCSHMQNAHLTPDKELKILI